MNNDEKLAEIRQILKKKAFAMEKIEQIGELLNVNVYWEGDE